MTYELVSNKCINSHWCACWLEGGEKCQCMFTCKVRVKHLLSGYVYVITQEEYQELLLNQKIEEKEQS